MTSQLRSALRAVVLPSSDAQSYDTPTRRLLDELGHDVTPALSADHALELINAEPTDLLVVDLTNGSNRDMLESLMGLPEAKRPVQMALFSDTIDRQLREWRKLSPSHVHVFLKPLHMHGLLTVLRQMERRKSAVSDA